MNEDGIFIDPDKLALLDMIKHLLTRAKNIDADQEDAHYIITALLTVITNYQAIVNKKEVQINSLQTQLSSAQMQLEIKRVK